MRESLAERFERAGDFLRNSEDPASSSGRRMNPGRRWLGVAILVLLLAAGCTGATPTPEASTPEATELTPPGAALVAETQQPIPAAVTSTLVTPTQAPPTPTPFPTATVASPFTPAPVVMALPSIADIVEKVRPAVVSILA